MNEHPLDPTKLTEDREGNNIAIQCPGGWPTFNIGFDLITYRTNMGCPILSRSERVGTPK